MRSSHRGTERLAELTREIGAVLSRVEAVTRNVLRALNDSNPNGDGQSREFSPEEHEEICGLAAALLIRLDQVIGHIKANGQFRPASPKTGPSHLRLVEKNEA